MIITTAYGRMITCATSVDRPTQLVRIAIAGAAEEGGGQGGQLPPQI